MKGKMGHKGAKGFGGLKMPMKKAAGGKIENAGGNPDVEHEAEEKSVKVEGRASGDRLDKAPRGKGSSNPLAPASSENPMALAAKAKGGKC